MKKTSIAVLAIILIILLSSGAFAISCSGTCTACSSFTNKGSCEDLEGQDGCSWDQESKVCSGNCNLCSTYSDESSCESQSGCSWEAVCGDNTCDASEDCSCSDCEGKQDGCQTNYYCSGGSCVYSGAGGTCAEAGGACKPNPCGIYLSCQTESGGSCDTGYCCTGSCTTEFSDCGNGECEPGETCLNCEVDCGSCIEEGINLAFRYPLNMDRLRRGTYNLKVIVFFGRRPTSSAKVYAEAPFFPEKLRLYDDSAHNDEKQFDGIYANEFIIDKIVKPGNYKIKVTAEKDKARDEKTITISVDPNLRIKLYSFQESYVKGERINLNSLIEDFKGPVPNVTVELSLDWLGDVLYNQTYKTNRLGKFLDSYLISFADPDGTWNLKINAEDKEGNEGSLELKSKIGTPAGVTYYFVNFLSPIKGSSYSRGETVPISIEVSEEDSPIKGAEVTFLSPKGKYLELTELEPGVYTTNYHVLFNDPIGLWRLAVQAIKTTANITRAGGNTIPLQVKSGKIRFELLSPLQERVFAGTKLNYKIKVTYPDGSIVRGAELTSKLSNNQTLTFLEEKPGIYTAEYVVAQKDAGSLEAKITVIDKRGNTATMSPVSLFVKKSTIIELYLVLFYQDVIRPYWWAFLAFILIVIMLSKPTYERKSLKRNIRKAKEEQEVVKKMQMEAEREYYKNKTISKEDFRRLIHQYKERLAKAKEQQRISKEKLEKKIKKSKKK